MTTPILTAARQSLWDAIDNFSSLSSAFKSKWRFDTDVAHAFQQIERAGLGDMPAIAIIPIDVQAQWALHIMMEFTDAYTIDIRAPKLSTCEDLVEKVWKAIYQAAPVLTSTVTYVRAATGYLPKAVGPIQRNPIATDSLKCWQFRFNVGLRLRQDPFTA